MPRVAENRLVTHAGPGGATSFAYDLDGIRYRKEDAAGATEYLVDSHARPYQEVLEEWTRVGASPPDLAMEYALGAALLWQRDGGGTQRWFHGDAQMSTRLLTTPGGAIASSLAYEAFGSDVAPPSPLPTSYRYTGQQADTATGGYYLRARYMAHQIGSFVSVDPFAGSASLPVSLHPYAYAGLSPTSFSDPSGRSFADIQVTAATMAALFSTYTNQFLRTFQVTAMRLHVWVDLAQRGMAVVEFGGAVLYIASDFTRCCRMGDSEPRSGAGCSRAFC